ncbi:hypothetical protein T4C_5497, partial [Trichinella pseudospiralis]
LCSGQNGWCMVAWNLCVNNNSIITMTSPEMFGCVFGKGVFKLL